MDVSLCWWLLQLQPIYHVNIQQDEFLVNDNHQTGKQNYTLLFCFVLKSLCMYVFVYQSFQFKLQGLLPGFEEHYALLLSVSLSQKLLATLTLPLQLTLAFQLPLSSLDGHMDTHRYQNAFSPPHTTLQLKKQHTHICILSHDRSVTLKEGGGD